MGGQARLWPGTSRAHRLYVDLRPHVQQIACAVLGEPPPPELIHDIAVDVVLSTARFRRESAFSTWIYSVVRHHVHNWMRGERNRRNLIQAVAQASLAPPSSRPDQAADSAVLVDELRTGFATLTHTQRECLLLVHCERWSPREVANRLHISPTAVRMHVHRARVRLRRWLDGE